MPAWSKDGREIYYVTREGKFMAATVHRENGFVADAPHLLFESHMRIFMGISRNQYDVTPDRRILVNVNAGEEQASSITLIQNWRAKFQ